MHFFSHLCADAQVGESVDTRVLLPVTQTLTIYMILRQRSTVVFLSLRAGPGQQVVTCPWHLMHLLIVLLWPASETSSYKRDAHTAFVPSHSVAGKQLGTGGLAFKMQWSQSQQNVPSVLVALFFVAKQECMRLSEPS